MVGQNKNCVGFPLFQFFVVDFWYMCVCYVIRWIIAHTYIIFFSQLVELFTWILLYVTVGRNKKKVKNDLVFWKFKNRNQIKKKIFKSIFFCFIQFYFAKPTFYVVGSHILLLFFFDDEIDIILSSFESCTFLHTIHITEQTTCCCSPVLKWLFFFSKKKWELETEEREKEKKFQH